MRALKDIRCGLLHSNIPPCCVAFFVLFWSRGGFSRTWSIRYRDWRAGFSRLDDRGFPLYHSWAPEYLQCPLCKVLRRKPNELRVGCGCLDMPAEYAEAVVTVMETDDPTRFSTFVEFPDGRLGAGSFTRESGI